MSRLCELCQKRSDFGQTRPFSLKATKKQRKPNTQHRTLALPGGQRQRIWICTRCIHTQTKQFAA